MPSLEAIIWYLFLLDSIGANITAWFFGGWFKKKMGKGFWKHLPVTKGWTFIYLALVVWVGVGLWRLGII
ncbi:hypothetical protein GOV13_00900 [Candidatus Pacearchaeota archaeon]|nr:hypothetical protein [Candidatus Pacearchaeota archaeon]